MIEIKNRHIVGMFIIVVIILVIGIIHYNNSYNKTMKILKYGESKHSSLNVDIIDSKKQVWNFEIDVDYFRSFNQDRFITLLNNYVSKLKYDIRGNQKYLEGDLEIFFASKMANVASIDIESLECYNDLFVEALGYDRGEK